MPTTSAADYVEALAEWAERADPTATVLIIPLSDRTLDWLDQGRDRFGPRFVLGIPSHEVVRSLLDKSQALALADRCGLSVLPWRHVHERSGIAEVGELHMPVIVRPARWDSHGATYFKQAVFQDVGSVTAFLTDRIDAGADLVVQEYLDAEPAQIVFALVAQSRTGQILSMASGRKRATSDPSGGVLAWGETWIDEDVIAAARRFASAAQFAGAGGIEFIRSGDTVWFIEFNPRLEAIHFLSDVAGVPHLSAVAADFLGLASEDSQQGRPGSLSQQPAAVWMETAWLSRSAAASRRLLRKHFGEFLRHDRRSMAIWDPADPRPAVTYVTSLVRHRWEGLRRSHGGRA